MQSFLVIYGFLQGRACEYDNLNGDKIMTFENLYGIKMDSFYVVSVLKESTISLDIYSFKLR